MSGWVDQIHKRQVVLPDGIDFMKTIGVRFSWEEKEQASIISDILYGYDGKYGTWELKGCEKLTFVDPDSILYADLKLRCKQVYQRSSERFYKLDDNQRLMINHMVLRRCYHFEF